MSVYAIGDVQGCFEPLQQLLLQLRFDATRDRLVFVGDLVNRGPQSLEVLRFVRSLGSAASTVLGNHDLHLLAVASLGKPGAKDTLDDILAAPDCAELLEWLRRQPLAYEEPHSGALVIHGGLPPQWDRRTALELAQEASAVIGGDDPDAFYRHMYGNEPDRWDPTLKGWPRLRFIVNCFTRLRYCSRSGRIDLKEKQAPGAQKDGLIPWFEVPDRRSADERIVFGHWSTLGRVEWSGGKVFGLDTGCVWGGSLTAMDLETGQLTSTGCAQYRRPGVSGD